MRDQVAVLDAHIEDLYRTLDQGESGKLWKRLVRTHGEFAKARAQGKVDEGEEKLAELERLIHAGARDTEVWDELRASYDLRRKLVESERRRITDAQMIVTHEQLVATLQRIAAVIREEITDRQVVRRLSERLEVIFEGHVGTVSTVPAEPACLVIPPPYGATAPHVDR